MEQKERGLRRDLRSKLLDGLLPAIVLFLLLLVVLMPLNLIASRFGGPGLMLYAFGLIGIAMFALQRGLVQRYTETTRAWYGMSAGLLAWMVVEITTLLTGEPMNRLTATILWILAGLTVSLLWRQYLPIGARAFSVVFLANWFGHAFVSLFNSVSGWSPAIEVLYRMMGYSSALGTVLILAWILLLSDRRIHRMWAAMWAVLLLTSAIYVLR
jgi:hypothetical protein